MFSTSLQDSLNRFRGAMLEHCTTHALGFLLVIATSSCFADPICGLNCVKKDDCGQSVDCVFCNPINGFCSPNPYSYYYLPKQNNGTNTERENYTIAALVTVSFVGVICCVGIAIAISWQRRRYATTRLSSVNVRPDLTNRGASSTSFATAVATPMYGATGPVAVPVALDGSHGGFEVATALTLAAPADSNTVAVPVVTAVY